MNKELLSATGERIRNLIPRLNRNRIQNITINYLVTNGIVGEFDHDCEEIKKILRQKLSLEDVLEALGENYYFNTKYGIQKIEEILEDSIVFSHCCFWDIGKPLSEQSQKTIKKIAELLNVKES